VPDDQAPLTATVTQLLLGVTPAEAAAGFTSAFSSFTAGTLRGVAVKGEVATLDLTTGFEHANNFSTANGSIGVTTLLTATVFQFPKIAVVEVKIEGKPWCGWENPCDSPRAVPLRIRR